MNRLRSVAFGALLLSALFAPGDEAIAHEIRPAYLQINEVASNEFEILWKQPSKWAAPISLKPTMSNGLLDETPDEQYSSNSFIIHRWNGRRLARESFYGAELRIEGLERTLTDALISIKFMSGEKIQAIVRPDNPAFIIQRAGSTTPALPEYLSLGFKHILAGLDHFCFVLALTVLVQGLRRLAIALTAFTVAHSVTLAVAALGYVQLDAPTIELLVALSIVFVAVELARSFRGNKSVTAERPSLIAFSFGLLHGFAFAGSLASTGLPQEDSVRALLYFNCGVEIGQLLFVVAVLIVSKLRDLLRISAGSVAPRWLVAYGVGGIASYWTLERLDILMR